MFENVTYLMFLLFADPVCMWRLMCLFQTEMRVLRVIAAFAHCLGCNLLPKNPELDAQTVSPSFHGTQDSPPMKGYFIWFAEYVECLQISYKWMYTWGMLSHFVCEGVQKIQLENPFT